MAPRLLSSQRAILQRQSTNGSRTTSATSQRFPSKEPIIIDAEVHDTNQPHSLNTSATPNSTNQTAEHTANQTATSHEQKLSQMHQVLSSSTGYVNSQSPLQEYDNLESTLKKMQQQQKEVETLVKYQTNKSAQMIQNFSRGIKSLVGQDSAPTTVPQALNALQSTLSEYIFCLERMQQTSMQKAGELKEKILKKFEKSALLETQIGKTYREFLQVTQNSNKNDPKKTYLEQERISNLADNFHTQMTRQKVSDAYLCQYISLAFAFAQSMKTAQILHIHATEYREYLQDAAHSVFYIIQKTKIERTGLEMLGYMNAFTNTLEQEMVRSKNELVRLATNYNSAIIARPPMNTVQ